MEIWELLKKLRIDRGIYQKKLAYNITTRDTLSRYENGKNSIPFVILLRLLDRLNITMDEFILYLEVDSVRDKNKKIKKFINDVKENKGSRKYTSEILRRKAYTTQNIVDIRNYLLIKTFDWYALPREKRKLNKNDKEYLDHFANYLEKVNEWGRFEMISFSSLLFLFNTNYISQRLKEIEKKISKYSDFEIFHSILSSLYNNAFLLMLERKNICFSKQYLQKLKTIQHRSLFAKNTQISVQFYKALIFYIEKNNKDGRKRMIEIFQGLELLELNSLINEFKCDLIKFEKLYSIPPIFE
ncbi:transcriptional regulator [Enterococcus villorum]|uniref:Transcriptional regulator n=1 Tax=Enterococcus villorum TaxID=112904 RepID=A0A1V8YB02_9ENTE|nr:Rgg/GadR/MutR family transcriptional regulator [Enterococcus villorum]OQO69765.1 transcriptional regulator [Enterococcus villorum]OQO74928.1 transcriptional regulator [Enterococcus villorum]